MDLTHIVMYLGFAMAAYSVVGNDVIQTLGTFLSSNENRPWYVLWAFAASILTIVLVYGWWANGGDISYGKLIGDPDDGWGFSNPLYPLPQPMSWWYLLPPVVLLIITRYGIPVSTTFLILSFFATTAIVDSTSTNFIDLTVDFFNAPGFTKMVKKSFLGYLFAMGLSVVVYLIITNPIEKVFFDNPLKEGSRKYRNWSIVLWISTGWLWTQWLAQDFANIYAYLPRQIDFVTMILSLLVILALLAYIFYQRGGVIQAIVRSKTHTQDIRSAAIINFVYGLVLYFFKGPIPMSTTWVFIGLLAGREYAIQYMIHRRLSKALHKMILSDAAKTTFGLIVSIILVLVIQWLRSMG